MSAKPVKVAWTSDSTQLRSDAKSVEASLDSAASTAQSAGAKIDGAFDSTAQHADDVASKGSQAAGALSGLGDLVGGKFGTAMMTGGIAMQAFADAGDLVNVVTESNIVRKVKDTAVTIGHTVASKAAAAASRAMAAGQWLLNTALAANPIGLVVVAIAALVAGFVIAYKRSETFRNIVNAAFEVVRTTVKGVVDFITVKVPAAFEKVLGFLSNLRAQVTSRVSGMWDGIKNGFIDVFNWIIDKWNGFHFTIPKIDLGPLGSIGGGTINFPDIPRLAGGGIVTRPTFALIGEAGPEAVIPLGRGFGTPLLIRIDLGGEQQDGISRGRRYIQDIDLARAAGVRSPA